MNDIIVHNANMPDKIVDLARFVLIGREKLNSVKAEVRAINKIEITQEVIKQKQDEAQMIAEVIIDAEVRLGELFKAIPTQSGKRTDIQPINSGVNRLNKSKKEILEDLGFSQMQANRLETLAENSNLVEYVKAEARENGELPTKARVFELAANQKKQESEINENDNDYSETKIINMTDFQTNREDEYNESDKFLDLRYNVYRHFMKIIDLVASFEITESKMDALRDNFDQMLLVNDHIGYINDAINKLNLIKTEIWKGKK